MKKIFKSVSVFQLWSGLFLISAAGLQGGENLLRNGQFLSLHRDYPSPVIWFVHPSVRAKAEEPSVEALPEEGDGSGSGILRIGKKGGQSLQVTQQLAADPLRLIGDLNGKSLVLKAQMRGEELDEQGALIAIQFFTTGPDGQRHFAGRMASKPITGTADWKDIEVKFDPKDVLPPGESLQQAEVCLVVNSDTGHVDFRNVDLEIVEP